MKQLLWKKLLLAFSLLCVSVLIQAQVQKAGVPWTVKNNYRIKAYSTINIAAAPSDWEQLQQAEEPGMKPYLFAWPVDTLIIVAEPGNRIFQDDEIEVFQLSIRTDLAYSINLIFDSYKLPEGAELYLYDPDREVTWGAYTSQNNKNSGKLATSPIPGNEIIVEMVVNKTLKNFDPLLTIGKISLGMKDAFGFKSGRFGRSGDCNVDINCPSGAEWQVLKRSVCKFIRGGTWICSGALINNTANDGRALLLTANHCIGTSTHASTSVFYFNYESPECYGEDGRLDQSISASVLLSTTNKLDFALVELSIAPPESYKPYYAGWDRTPVLFYDTVTCIHHPAGDVKKISIANRRVATGDFGSGFDENTHWKISQWDVGTTEGGSSGSPLFSKDFRIIGDLTGGDASCSYNFNDYFQKLWVSWDCYPDHDDQLRFWLDPEGENPLIWNGFDPFSEGKPLANFKYLPEKPKAGQYIRLQDISSGSPLFWEWTFENGVPASSSDKNPLVLFEDSGYKQIVLVVSNDLGTDTIRQTIQLEDRIDIFTSQRRLVKGAEVEIKPYITGEYYDLEWEIQDGIQTYKMHQSVVNQVFEQNGMNSLRLTAFYENETLSLHHQNIFKIIPEELIFAGEIRSVYSQLEPLGVFSLGNNGVIPGINSLGYDAYANRFRRNSDTSAIISGVVVNILELEYSDPGVYLKAGIWDPDWNLLREDSILLNPKTMPFSATVWFNQTVGMDTLVYAGIILPKRDDLVFSIGMTMTRNEYGANDAWGRRTDSWSPLNQAVGLNSALGIQLEASNLYEDLGSQIKVLTNENAGHLTMDLGNLVYDNYILDIYNMQGQQMTSSTQHSGSILDVSFNIPVSGIYLIQLKLDYMRFTKKIILIRD
ncbi:MAG: trypsin-like peptidase domain-containing protein [Bacteroidota bacterium]|nr:trypsin-like peptidase domain-containing protein [Bacteroidota bacterium]